LSFDVLSVICRLHNLWSPFNIPFYLVPPIVFSFRAKALFYLGTVRRFSWNGTTVSHWRFHDNRRMNTSTDVSKFKISPFFLNVESCLSRCYGALTVTCTFQYCPWTGSIKPTLQHFQFCCVGISLRDSVFLYFEMHKYNNYWINRCLHFQHANQRIYMTRQSPQK
jgi:hypothetical protein